MKDRWQIHFNKGGQLLHTETDMQLVPKGGDIIFLPNQDHALFVHGIAWDYLNKIVIVKI